MTHDTPPDRLARPGKPTLAYRRRAGAGPTILFLPGYQSDMGGTKAVALDAWAEAQGRAMLRFDYAGCGDSAGVPAEQTLASWLGDALDAIDALTEGPLVLVGSSMGGWLMLLAALARAGRVAALVGIAAAPDFTDWGFDDARRAILAEDGLIAEPSPYSDAPTITTLRFWESGQAHLLLGGAIDLAMPVRLIQGMMDAEVPVSVTLRLGRALAGGDVQTILVKDGDHRLSRPQDIALLLTTIGALDG